MSSTTGSSGDEDLWGARASDWCQFQEPQFVPLYEDVFDATGVGLGVRLLDAGCGAGLALSMAESRGAIVSGFDPSEALLAIASDRVPKADLRAGTIEDPPHRPGSFDVVTLFHVAHHVPTSTLFAPLHDQGRPGGMFAATAWGRAEQCAMAEVFAAIGSWSPGNDGRFALAAPGRFERLLEASGFSSPQAWDVACTFCYPDLEASLKGMLSAAPFVIAVRQAGEEAVRAALTGVLAPRRDSDGSIRLPNVFRCVAAAV